LDEEYVQFKKVFKKKNKSRRDILYLVNYVKELPFFFGFVNEYIETVNP